jgi:transcription initiation factor TFIIB
MRFTSTSKERRLSRVLFKINEICSSMSLPKTLVETAAMLYLKLENKNKVSNGISITCMATAAIYLTCKICSIVLPLEEILKTGLGEQDQASLKLASKYYRIMVVDMGRDTSIIDRYN